VFLFKGLELSILIISFIFLQHQIPLYVYYLIFHSSILFFILRRKLISIDYMDTTSKND